MQIFGDTHGNIVHLFERDCSLQRRHQKVIEEAPAPGMDEATREQLCAAAVKAAKAVDYVGAGTIEFIADASEGLRADRIWFMEMNTRLQVEHPVTEEITGVDLVEWQLRVASGEELPLKQEELSINGWAMEARLYAEDPAKGFLPSVGLLERFALPIEKCRIESGFEQFDEISSFYDPMLAKIIVHASTRQDAAENLAEACNLVIAWPVKTNAGFLSTAAAHSGFISGDLDTGFIAEHETDLTAGSIISEDALSDGAKAMILISVIGRGNFTAWHCDVHDAWNAPWAGAVGFRLNAPEKRNVRINVDGVTTIIEIDRELNGGWTRLGQRPDGILISADGRSALLSFYRADGGADHHASSGDILSPMPGRIIAVEVTAGQTVIKGQKLVTLEAMKMEHSLTAPFDGVVAELNAQIGAQVQVDALLVRIEGQGIES